MEVGRSNLLFLGLADASGNLIAKAGQIEVGDSAFQLKAEGVWFHRQALPPGRGGPRWMDPDGPQGSYLVVGIDAASADFILRQAWIHVTVAGAAVLTLWTLTFYLLGANRRLLEARLREESERHLADLGRMSATLAHEIRNPLGAVKGLTQVIREDLPADHPARSHLETVISEAGRLEKLVTDLLAFARPRRPQLESTSLREILAKAVELVEVEATSRQIAIRADVAPGDDRVGTDPDGLRQVLLNALRNAFEASPPNSIVEVSAGVDSAKSRYWIEVRDRGPGLGNVDPEDLFLPFRTTKLQHGTGLGLAVSRRIVDSLGGTISLGDRPGGGAALRVEVGL
jgi:signal transduction histidine kinase